MSAFLGRSSLLQKFGVPDLLDDYEGNCYNNHMRPLYHPSVDEITVQGILYALSDPARVRIFLDLVDAECAKNCATFANINKRPLPKSTLSQHFKVLRESGLIRSTRKGVELQNEVRCADLKKRFTTMITEILKAYQDEAKRALKRG